VTRRIAAAIPAYQAERCVADVVHATAAVVPDVLVIDDGSTDATAARAREAGAEVESLPVNRGKGAALRRAFDILIGRGFDAMLTLDADGQHLASDIPALLECWSRGADLVLGSRVHLYEHMSRLRRASNTTSSRLISFAAGLPTVDTQTGFRIYSRRVLETTGFPEWRFDAESAVIVRAARAGFRIETVPISLGFVDGRATSHYRPVIDSVRIARSVVRAYLEFLTGARKYEERAGY
jgi:glycosyltransferase involved in cell wall biosynthesis